MAGWVSERKKILQSRQILKVLHVRAFTLKLLSSMLMISYYLDSWHHSSRGFCRFSHDTASTFLKTFSPPFPLLWCSGYPTASPSCTTTLARLRVVLPSTVCPSYWPAYLRLISDRSVSVDYYLDVHSISLSILQIIYFATLDPDSMLI